VVSAYPNAKIDEEVYIKQPTGFNDNSGMVCRLNKALYGLKQAARQWEQHLKNDLQQLDLYPLKTDPSVYISIKGEPLILITYIDDILAISPSKERI